MFSKKLIQSFVVIGVTVMFWGCASEQLESARLYIREENWSKAEEMLLAAIEVEPDDAEIYFLLGKEIYAHQAEWDKMNSMFDKAMSLDRDKKLRTGEPLHSAVQNERAKYWSVYYNKGADSYNVALQSEGSQKKESLEKAIDAFNTAIRIYGEEPKTYRNLLFCYVQLKDSEQIALTLNQALRKNPEDGSLLITAGKVSLDDGDVDKAIEYLEKAIRVDRRNSSAIRLLADAYYEKGDKEGAIFAYKKAIRNDPDNVDLNFNLGVLYLQIEDYDFAEEKFRKVLQLNPDDFEAIMGVGEAYERLEQWEDAEYYYNKALRIEAENATLIRALARVIYRQGRVEEGSELLNRAKALE
ncbi:MAG: tetratricopeptide repeat protein [Candidatus Marinimicrobia bacterium]|nr:tetratricopeptide repeat protein [Candidatus Neomarinimicrobiota bacterium]